MRKTWIALALVIGVSVAIRAQTSADLGAKYRQITSYEVRPGIVMTPRYAQDGQVCEMIVEKRAKTDKDIIFGSSFAEKEWKDVVDELVPPRKRGKDVTELLNTTVDGGFIAADYTYENVKIRVQGVTRPKPTPAALITITWSKRTCAEESRRQQSSR
jgi:hypothetical protein